jgi:hypothetical protein
MIFNSKRSLGNIRRHSAAIMFDCASANALPRVQIIMGRSEDIFVIEPQMNADGRR